MSKINPRMKHLIVGMGKTGYSVAQFLFERHMPFVLFDTRIDPPYLRQCKQYFSDIPCYLEALPDEIWEQINIVVTSPGLSEEHPVLKKAKALNHPIIGDIELFAQTAKAPVVAITGTNGKSTVTAMVGEIGKTAGLEVRVGGNFGTPALNLLADREPDFYVLELSSFQLERTNVLKPQISTILNITPDHIDRYDSMDEYKSAKQRIYQHATMALFNRGCPDTFPGEQALSQPCLTLSFGLDEPKPGEVGIRQVAGAPWLAIGAESLLPVSALPAQNDIHLQNTLAAVAISWAMQVPTFAILKAVESFKSLPHRLELIAKTDRLTFINDSKATNPGATIAALEGLKSGMKNKIVLLAGGDGKDADFVPMRARITESVRLLVLYGRDAEKLAIALVDTVPIHEVQTLEEAVSVAIEHAEQDDIVLLAPACSSWDQYSNYQQRGQHFEQCVKSYLDAEQDAPK